MKTLFYLIMFLGTVSCPESLYSQVSRISGLEHKPLNKTKSDSLQIMSYGRGISKLTPRPSYKSHMPILRANGNSRILIAKLDSINPYHYKMPVKKIDIEE